MERPGQLPDASVRSGDPRWVLPSLLAFFAAVYARMFLVVGGRVTDEELHTPTVAALLQAGHPWDLPALQYMSFCGGCTAETLMVVPFFHLFGPALPVWRLLGLAAGLSIAALAWLVLKRQLGWLGSAFGLLLLLLAPGFYRENGVVSFGSHYEVGVLVLFSVAIWQRWVETHRARYAFVLGVSFGLAFWFSYSSAFAPPILFLLWVVPMLRSGQFRRVLLHSILVAFGFVLGVVPLVLTQWSLREQGLIMGEAPLAVYGRDIGALLVGPPSFVDRLRFLFGPSYWSSLFHPSFGPGRGLPGLAYALVQVGVLLVGLRAFCATLVESRPVPRRTQETGSVLPPSVAPLTAAVGGMLGLYVLLFVLLAPIQGPVPPSPPVPANNLRYFVPIVPLLAVLAPLILLPALSGTWIQSVFARLGIAVLLGVGGVSLVADLSNVSGSLEPLHRVAVDYAALEGRPTLAVPPMADLAPGRRISPLESSGNDRFAARVVLHIAGKTYGEAAGQGPPTRELKALGSWLLDLPDDQRWVVLSAFIRSFSQTIGGGDVEASQDFLRLLESIQNEELRYELWRQAVWMGREALWDLHEDLEQARSNWPSWLEPHWSSERKRALAWTLGEMSGYTYRQVQEPNEELRRALLLLDRLGPLPIQDYLHGLGKGMGERWGYSERVSAQLEAALAEVGGAASFKQGFSLSAELHFL